MLLYSEPNLAVFRGVDHQWDGELFATAGAQVDIWNHNRFFLNLLICSTVYKVISNMFTVYLLSQISAN